MGSFHILVSVRNRKSFCYLIAPVLHVHVGCFLASKKGLCKQNGDQYMSVWYNQFQHGRLNCSAPRNATPVLILLFG